MNIFIQNKFGLSLTYGLIMLENLSIVIYPSAIGIAIDGILSGNFIKLIYFVALSIFHLCIGVFRHVYDTHIFTKIYSQLAPSAITKLHIQGVDRDKIAARISLSREVADFMQIEIPSVFSVSIVLIGSLSMLFFYDFWIGIMALCCFVPFSIVNYWFFKKSYSLNEDLNNHLEKEISVISTLKNAFIKRHFLALRICRIRISNAEAKTWGIIEIVLILLLVSILLRLGRIENVTTGFIYAALSYIWKINEGIEEVPHIVQNFARVKDISERLDDEKVKEAA